MDSNSPDSGRHRLEAFADTVIVTTTNRVERHRVDREIGLESVEFVVEGGLISELTSEFHRLLRQGPADSGGQLNSIRHPAIRLLTLRAAEQGANAILNTELVYEGHAGTRARFVLRGTLVALVPHPSLPSSARP
mgnify:FL=1